ncbi:MAG: ATP-dependent helicase, partial [Candidatus Dojkabacteria bacterium]
MQLNEQQEKAASIFEGPLLIIAGAGSGKTRVLTERLARMLEAGITRPEEILLVTFTNKAAGEIKERVAKRIAVGKYIPWAGTFHSIAVKILRRDIEHLGINSNFTIYDGDDQLALVKQIMKERNISLTDHNPRAILGTISNAKSELIKPKEFSREADGYFQELVAEIYEAYQKGLRANTALDFDDLLVLTVELLENHPQVREKYQQNFSHVMVDEYQDTNHVQYRMVKLLAEPQNNICVVGDDDQSIYGWRGANVRNILEFEHDFSGAQVIKLEQNYRSTKKILQAGNEVVKGVSGRKSKQLWTENGDGENITLYEALDEKDESFWVAEMVDNLTDRGIDPEEIVVLYRINAQSRALEEAFMKTGIAYRIVGGIKFYERKEVKDMLAYLRIIHNPADELSLLRVINVPSRKIGAKTISSLWEKAASLGISPLDYIAEQGLEEKSGIQQFAKLIRLLRTEQESKNVVDLIHSIAEKSGYIDMLNDGTEQGKMRIENIQELITVATKYQQLEPAESLQAFLEEVALVEASTEKDNPSTVSRGEGDESTGKRSAVTLMTAHGAKGLEYEHVFIIGLEEGIFPHSRALSNATEVDEER